ncbi:MAG: aspartyl protease family protein, partial [Bacteroidota bacterium]
DTKILKKGRIDIPFSYENNLIVVNITFNQVFPLKFLFDTGAEHTILTRREITDLLSVNYSRKFILYGADLSTELTAYLAQGISIKMGEMELRNRNILVLEEDYFNFDEFSGIDVQGIIGADIFRRFVVQINYKRKVIRLYPRSRFKEPGKSYVKYPVEIFKSRPYINVPIRTPSDSLLQIKLLMDSGSSLPLILYPETDPSLTIPENVIPAQLGIGLGGYLEGVIGRTQYMNVAQTELIDVITSFQNLVPGTDTIALNNRNGILGNKSLEHFHVIIDYVRQELYLKSNTKGKKPRFKYDKSGLFLVASGKELNRFKIASVVPGSPADQAGLQRDDDLKRINGLPCILMSLSGIQKRFKKKEGKKYSIVYRRDGKNYKTTLTLQKII